MVREGSRELREYLDRRLSHIGHSKAVIARCNPSEMKESLEETLKELENAQQEVDGERLERERLQRSISKAHAELQKMQLDFLQTTKELRAMKKAFPDHKEVLAKARVGSPLGSPAFDTVGQQSVQQVHFDEQRLGASQPHVPRHSTPGLARGQPDLDAVRGGSTAATDLAEAQQALLDLNRPPKPPIGNNLKPAEAKPEYAGWRKLQVSGSDTKEYYWHMKRGVTVWDVPFEYERALEREKEQNRQVFETQKGLLAAKAVNRKIKAEERKEKEKEKDAKLTGLDALAAARSEMEGSMQSNQIDTV